MKFLQFIGNNHLLMVHPGQTDDSLQKIDPVTLSRDLESDFLKSHNFLDILETKSILLRPFHTIIS